MVLSGGRRRPAGIVVGSLIGTVFGLVFVVANSGGLAAPWPVVLRSAGVLVAVALIIDIVRVARSAVPQDVAGARARGFADRGYRIIVGLEAAALFGGLVVLGRVFDMPEVGVAWVALVVGVHFVGLARIWRMPMYTVLGVAMTVLGVAGFVAYAVSGAVAVGLVSGVGSGIALFAAVAYGLWLFHQGTPEQAV